MAYATGVPSNFNDVVNALINFMVSDGGFTLGSTWTFSGSPTTPDTASTGTSYTARALSRDGQFVTLCWKTTAPDALFMNSSTAISTSLKLYNQTGAAPASCKVTVGTTPVRYHLFSDGNATHCVVERLSGVFVHINAGVIQKYGSFTGGIFVSGTGWGSDANAIFSTAHCRPFDGKNSSTSIAGHVRASYLTASVAYFTDAETGFGFVRGLPLLIDWLLDRSPNSYNGRAALLPIELVIGLELGTSAPTAYKPLGRVNNAAYLNIANLNPGDTLLTDWMVFPLSAKNAGGTGTGFVNSLNYGLAYRK